MQRTMSRILVPIVYIVYLLFLALIMSRHEPWGDEIHSWNIVKASSGLPDLLHNARYEGHPPLWYFLLWPLSRVTHDFVYVEVLHFVIASAVVFLVLFRSPFPLSARVTASFGYLLFYEYAVLSRNYAIGVLVALLLCMLLQDRRKTRYAIYYPLLLLLSCTHLVGLVLAASFHIYLLSRERNRFDKKSWFLHAAAGMILLLPAALSILPPGDSQLNTGFWLTHANIHQLTVVGEAPLRAFLPLPAWWEYHFWNTQFLLELATSKIIVKGVCLLASLLLCLMAYAFLRRREGALLFMVNLGLTLLVGLVFPLTTARYCGFIFIGFLASWWLSYLPAQASTISQTSSKISTWTGCILLALQVPGAFFTAWKDYRLPFSLAYEAPAIAGEVPAPEKFTCDYWALNPLAAFADKPYYCLDLQKELAFLRWDRDFASAFNNPHRYSSGADKLFREGNRERVYMLSTASPSELEKTDSLLFSRYRVRLEDFREGAIEKGSNLYLYVIELPSPPPPLVRPVPDRHA